MVMLMDVGDEFVDVQFGKRPHRIGRVPDHLQHMVGRDGLGHHRKQVVDLVGRGIRKAGVFERLVGVVDK
jgi:hypothetical protein